MVPYGIDGRMDLYHAGLWLLGIERRNGEELIDRLMHGSHHFWHPARLHRVSPWNEVHLAVFPTKRNVLVNRMDTWRAMPKNQPPIVRLILPEGSGRFVLVVNTKENDVVINRQKAVGDPRLLNQLY